MKILEINKFNYVQGGADKHFLDVVSLFKSKGHEVAVFAMESPRNDFSPWKKYFVSYVGYGATDSLWQKIKGTVRMFYSIEARSKIKKLLDDFQPDIVHIHNIYHQISPSILAEIKKRKIPIIMTVHDYKLICPNYLLLCNGVSWEDMGENKYRDFIRQKCFKNSYWKSLLVVLEFRFHEFFNSYDKSIDLYITPSEFTKNKLVRNGMSAEKIKVVPLFVRENELAEIAKIETKEKYAFHFGRLSKEKGIDKMIEIFKELPEVNLYLAGNVEGDLEIPEATNIKQLGFLSQAELAPYIKNSALVISASRLPETFGLIALEAIKNGKPFVGFDSGAFKEIIENNKQGYLCKDEGEMKEKMQQLMADEGLRILFSRQALARAKNFDSERYYEQMVAIFRELLSKNKLVDLN